MDLKAFNAGRQKREKQEEMIMMVMEIRDVYMLTCLKSRNMESKYTHAVYMDF